MSTITSLDCTMGNTQLKQSNFAVTRKRGD
jgi:hypothetical protein